jgi:hypothetical protein
MDRDVAFIALVMFGVALVAAIILPLMGITEIPDPG